MAIAFKEKRALQKVIAEKMDALKQGALPFKEKRAAQKALKDAFDKLAVKIDQGNGTPNAKLQALIAGEYNGKPPQEFLVIVDEIISELGELTPPTKTGIIGYCEANRNKMKEAA